MATAQLKIDGTITYDDYWCDEWGDPYSSPRTSLTYLRDQFEFEKMYREAEGITDVRVTINSPGGVADVGYMMYDYLVNLGLPITTVIQGECGSIATAVFLAGKTRLIPRYSKMFVHMPERGTHGNILKHRIGIDILATETQKLIDFYVQGTGQSEGTIAALLAANQGEGDAISAERAVELGFATGILEPVTARIAFRPSPPQPATATAHRHPLQTTPTTNMSQPAKKGLRALFQSITNMLGEEPVTDVALPLADGTNIYTVSADPVVGDVAYTDEGMSVMAPDGDYALANGTTITVAGGAGVITVIMPADAPSPDPAVTALDTPATTDAPAAVEAPAVTNDARITELEGQLATALAERDALQVTNTKLEEQAQANNRRFEAITNRLNQMGKLIGEKESPQIDTAHGGGNAPALNLGTAPTSDEDAMRNAAKRFDKKPAKAA